MTPSLIDACGRSLKPLKTLHVVPDAREFSIAPIAGLLRAAHIARNISVYFLLL